MEGQREGGHEERALWIFSGTLRTKESLLYLGGGCFLLWAYFISSK